MKDGYEIKIFRLEDDNLNQQAVNLISEVFGFDYNISKLRLNTGTNENSKFIGAFYNGDLVAINAFIHHTLSLKTNDKIKVYAYQTCWTATHSDHRGKGLFYEIIKKSLKILPENSSFIFGYPNKVSKPLFLKIFKFKKIEVYKKNIPWFMLNFIIKNKKQNKENITYNPDFSETFNWKRKEYGDKIIIFENEDNKIWGKIITRNFKGFKVNGFAVGGVLRTNPKDLKRILRSIRKKYKVCFFQFVFSENSDFFNFIKKPVENKFIEPLIIFSLDNIDVDNLNLNFLNGIKDVFSPQ